MRGLAFSADGFLSMTGRAGEGGDATGGARAVGGGRDVSGQRLHHGGLGAADTAAVAGGAADTGDAGRAGVLAHELCGCQEGYAGGLSAASVAGRPAGGGAYGAGEASGDVRGVHMWTVW